MASFDGWGDLPFSPQNPTSFDGYDNLPFSPNDNLSDSVGFGDFEGIDFEIPVAAAATTGGAVAYSKALDPKYLNWLKTSAKFLKFGGRFIPYVGAAITLYDLARWGYDTAYGDDGIVHFDESGSIVGSGSLSSNSDIASAQIENSAKMAVQAKGLVNEVSETVKAVEKPSLAETLRGNTDVISKSILEGMTLLHSELVNVNTNLFGIMTYLDQFLSTDFSKEERQSYTDALLAQQIEMSLAPRAVKDANGNKISELSVFDAQVMQGYANSLSYTSSQELNADYPIKSVAKSAIQSVEKAELMAQSLNSISSRLDEVSGSQNAISSTLSQKLGAINNSISVSGANAVNATTGIKNAVSDVSSKINEDIELKKEAKVVKAIDGSVLGNISFYDAHATMGLREKFAMSQLPVLDLNGNQVGLRSAVQGDVVRSYVDAHAVTNQTIHDLDGVEVATAKPLDIALQKNATIAKKTTDENNLELDDEDFSLMDIDFSILNTIVPDTRLSDEIKDLSDSLNS